MPQCKRPGPPVLLEYHGGTLTLQSILHPKGCMGARTTHLDVEVERDPCGLLEFFGRGGSCLPARREGGGVIVDLSGVLGYPCVLRLRGLKYTGRVYLMVSRRGSLYIAPC